MRTVFFGTPEWAVPSLDALLESDIEVVGVVTNPDRPAGRGMELRPSPVKQRAASAGLGLLQPRRASDPELRARLEELEADVCTVVAYGKILPGELLGVPPLGFVNVHFSLLPSYRGAAPVQRALIDGAPSTGVSIMVLTEGMDEGPVLAAREVAVRERDGAEALGARLASIGAELLVATLPAYAEGRLEPLEQDHARATYAPKITSSEARIDWSAPAGAIRNRVRGLTPAPGAWTTLRDRRVKLLWVEPTESGDLAPGELAARDEALVVGTGEGSLEIARVQLEGKRAMTGEAAARGLRLAPGERFQ